MMQDPVCSVDHQDAWTSFWPVAAIHTRVLCWQAWTDGPVICSMLRYWGGCNSHQGGMYAGMLTHQCGKAQFYCTTLKARRNMMR